MIAPMVAYFGRKHQLTLPNIKRNNAMIESDLQQHEYQGDR